MPHDRESIADILASARRILEYVAGKSLQDFRANVQCQDAVIRRFEIIGEAAKRVSASMRNRHPTVPWKEMSRMRDRVIHGYETVDWQIVWQTIEQDLPRLITALDAILQDLQSDAGGGAGNGGSPDTAGAAADQ